MARAKKISAYAIGVLAAGNTYVLANIAGVTKRLAALASNITNVPAGGLSSVNVQDALNELDTEKFDKAGGAITGVVTTTENVGVGDSGPLSLGTGTRGITANGSAGGFYVVRYNGANTGYMIAESGGVKINTFTGKTLSLGTEGVSRFSCDTSGNLSSTGNLSVGGTVSSAGVVGIGPNIDASVKLYVTGTNTSGANYSGLFANSAGQQAAAFFNDLTARFCNNNLRFAANGDVTNTNNYYGAISDGTRKRDVTDTGPKLSKVLAMRVVNYYLKADPTNTKLLGMIAQELREISPGLVDETPDYEDVIVEPARTDTIPKQRQKTVARTFDRPTVVMRDGMAVRVVETASEEVPLWVEVPLFGEDGQPIVDVIDGKQVPAVHRVPVMEDYTETVDVPAKIERRPTGTTTLSIKYSVLVPMLIKAMQEMHVGFDGRINAEGEALLKMRSEFDERLKAIGA